MSKNVTSNLQSFRPVLDSDGKDSDSMIVNGSLVTIKISSITIKFFDSQNTNCHMEKKRGALLTKKKNQIK